MVDITRDKPCSALKLEWPDLPVDENFGRSPDPYLIVIHTSLLILSIHLKGWLIKLWKSFAQEYENGFWWKLKQYQSFR